MQQEELTRFSRNPEGDDVENLHQANIALASSPFQLELQELDVYLRPVRHIGPTPLSLFGLASGLC